MTAGIHDNNGRSAGGALEVQLRTGLAALGLNLDANQQGQLLAYVDLLSRWNKVQNLTAVRESGAMVSHHLLDSLSVAKVLTVASGSHVMDVGSGAGLPGVPLAIAWPSVQFSLVEPMRKRVAFLRECVSRLKLANVTIVHSRIQDVIGGDQPPALIVCRAFTSLTEFIDAVSNLAGRQTTLLAMKGAKARQEIDGYIAVQAEEKSVIQQELLNNYQFTIDTVQDIDVPGVAGERVLVVLRSPGFERASSRSVQFNNLQQQ